MRRSSFQRDSLSLYSRHARLCDKRETRVSRGTPPFITKVGASPITKVRASPFIMKVGASSIPYIEDER
jgi:hypothetical protein